MTDPVQINQLIPTFHVADVVRAAEWYRDVLGFEIAFVDEPNYAGVTVCGQVLHLAQWQKEGELEHGQIFVRLANGVDDYFSRVKQRGGEFYNEPKDQPYGYRECNLRDLDGNFLHIGEPIAQERQNG